MRRWAVAIGLPLLLVSGVAVVRLQARAQLDARVAAQLTEARASLEVARAQAGEVGQLRQQAFARFDTAEPGSREQAEALWTRALELGGTVETRYLQGMKALESAWALDPGRTEVRELLGDVLAERIALAERDRRGALREELLSRLAAYDTTGARRQRLQAPARLALSLHPAGAQVRLAEATGAAARARELGKAPLRELSLPAGSYVLMLESPGHAPVRLPVLLHAGERLELDVKLPRASAVPEGFVFVPAGRFLRGSADDDQVRQLFFNAAPLHTSSTGAYLISRHEVTFADWIAFLQALPPAERAERMPGASSRSNMLQLELLPTGRWRFTQRPTSAEYTALDGEPIRYGKRSLRAEQDWRRFPVAGISYNDAEAYAAWLDRTGRVPGARLCTEFEWERAARGADGRRYPSGERLAPDDANHDLTYGREPLGFGPDEVGSHPGSRSPFGVDDMSGNVWEWVSASEEPLGPIIRGGSWYQDCGLSCQLVNREPAERSQRSPRIGLRLCASSTPG